MVAAVAPVAPVVAADRVGGGGWVAGGNVPVPEMPNGSDCFVPNDDDPPELRREHRSPSVIERRSIRNDHDCFLVVGVFVVVVKTKESENDETRRW